MSGPRGWPSDGSLALSLVIVVEEGAERTPASGDSSPEPFTEGYSPEGGWRNWFVESMWEYGSRAGLPRVLDTLARHDVAASFAWTSEAARANRALLGEVIAAGHEIMAAGRRALPGPGLSADEERDNVIGGIEHLTAMVASFDPGAVPKGWFGRWPTDRTPALVREAGLEYTSDTHAGDAPYLTGTPRGELVAMPWTPDLDDSRFWCDPRMSGYRTADDFLDVMERAALQLLREVDLGPRMMTVVLHPRIIGSPARIGSLEAFLERFRHEPRISMTTRASAMDGWIGWTERSPSHAS